MAAGARGPAGRDRMIATAAALLGSRGVEGTSFHDVLTESRAPRGSIYYYFPDGKQQLVESAVRWTTEAVLSYQRSCRSRTPSGVIDHFVRFFQRSLSGSACRSGCPLAAVAIGSYAPPGTLRDSVRPGFRAWSSLLASQLRSTGLPADRARRLAWTTLASVEGALILARAEGSLRPLETVRRQLHELAGPALRPRPPRTGMVPGSGRRRVEQQHIEPTG